MAAEVGIRELKNRASALIEEVATEGKIITVTKRGKPVARIVPAQRADGMAKLVAAGRVTWGGRKPTIPPKVKLRGKGKSMTDYIVEERDRRR